MRKYLMKFKMLIVLAVLVYPITALSERVIDFSDAETVENLISGKSWNCKMVDAYGESIGIYKFHAANGKKVKGSVKVPHVPVCDSDILKGKLKKNRLKYMAPNLTPCREVSGLLEFSYNEEDQVIATGSYRIGGTHKRGTYVCSIQE